MTGGWELLAQDVLLDSPHVRVVRETVRTPSRPDGREWTKVIRKVGVTIAPRLPNQSFVLIREERVPARRDFWQFPAGQVDDESSPDAIEAAARRELREEAGCEAGESFVYLGKFFTSPGFTDEHTHQFVATGVAWDRNKIAHDSEEQILEVKSFTAQELRRMVADQIIEDANTLGLYARLEAGGWLS